MTPKAQGDKDIHIKLFLIEPGGRELLYIAARSAVHAAGIFVGFELARGRQDHDFSIMSIDAKLPAERQLGRSDILSHGIPGFARFDPELGWSVAPPA